MKKINKILSTLTKIGVALLFLLILPYRTVYKTVFNWRKKTAIKKANKMAIQLKKRVYVIQIERHFIAGTRNEMRRYNKGGQKITKKLAHSHYADFDYRRAIIYTAEG